VFESRTGIFDGLLRG